MQQKIIFSILAAIFVAGLANATEVASLASIPPPVLGGDWLVNPAPFHAGIYHTAKAGEIALDNGLFRRVFRISPNAATVALDNLMTGESELRSVRPEAMLTMNGREHAVGGLRGQPIQNYLLPEWGDFYKAHRAILDSDLIHLRRADGRDWDGWLHVNPALKERGLAMIYNPLNTPVQRRLKLPLYYTGLTNQAIIHRPDGPSETLTLARDYSVVVTVNVPACGRAALIIEAP